MTVAVNRASQAETAADFICTASIYSQSKQLQDVICSIELFQCFQLQLPYRYAAAAAPRSHLHPPLPSRDQPAAAAAAIQHDESAVCCGCCVSVVTRCGSSETAVLFSLSLIAATLAALLPALITSSSSTDAATARASITLTERAAMLLFDKIKTDNIVSIREHSPTPCTQRTRCLASARKCGRAAAM